MHAGFGADAYGLRHVSGCGVYGVEIGDALVSDFDADASGLCEANLRAISISLDGDGYAFAACKYCSFVLVSRTRFLL